MRTATYVMMLSLLAAGCQSPQGDPSAENPVTPEAEPFFVGRWAAAETACGHAAWTITENGLATPGEASCTFDRLTRIPGGLDIAATCPAEGAPSPGRHKLRSARSPPPLHAEGGPPNPTGRDAARGKHEKHNAHR